MPYLVEIIRKEEQITSAWPGGTTTQLVIYPKASDYKARNFMWRLSSACVDIEESIFTSLPGILRHIMIIEGEMRLIHEAHHSILLKPFEQDSFSGDWTTKSIGRARDFNLMLGQGCKGSLEALRIAKGMNVRASANPRDIAFMNSVDAFYCAVGGANVAMDGDELYTLYEGDLMVVNRVPDKYLGISFECNSQADTAMIRARITY